MSSKYEIGQKVVIAPANNQPATPRGSGLEPYAGQVGEVTNYHWICPNRGEVFYIYTIRLETDLKEVVLHEDELETFIA